jgi:peptidase A4-like protein
MRLPKPIPRCSRGLLAVAVVTTVAIGVGTEAFVRYSPANNVPAIALGPFVGYRFFGTTHSISAKWRVPRILQTSEAQASTWIGLQNESGAFIQVGTTEDSFVGSNDLARNEDIYAGFWSGDKVSFRPQPTFRQSVHPGDLISASIAETKSGWRVQIVDARDRTKYIRTLKIGATDLTEAEWFQEDPTNTATDSPLPYPQLSQIRLTDLKRNGSSPSFSLDNQEWMSVPGMDFAPTELKHDSYQVVPVHLNAIQARWVASKVSYMIVATKFDLAQDAWRTRPPTSFLARSELQPFLEVLHAYEQTLENRSWPLVPRSGINELVTALRHDAAALTALANAEPNPGGNRIARLDQSRTNLRIAEQRVTNKMGLP